MASVDARGLEPETPGRPFTARLDDVSCVQDQRSGEDRPSDEWEMRLHLLELLLELECPSIAGVSPNSWPQGAV